MTAGTVRLTPQLGLLGDFLQLSDESEIEFYFVAQP
jgi:hypothetical protein